MKRLNLDDYYETFISAAILQGEATKTGDSKTANRQYTFLKMVFVKAEKLIDINDVESVNTFYARLRNHEEPNVQLFACAHSLALGISIKESENILAKLSQNKNIGILRLNAEMTLKVWKEQGYLRF
jgi:hypothetical protein